MIVMAMNCYFFNNPVTIVESLLDIVTVLFKLTHNLTVLVVNKMVTIVKL